MQKTASHIIKGDQVHLDGILQLDTTVPIPQTAGKTPTPSMPPQARIIEQNNEFATVEVTCSCGQKILVKCIHANHAPKEGAN
jgi:hypothetical protein